MLSLLNFSDHPCLASEESANAKVVVLIHGLFGNLDNLSAIRRHLQQYFRVISIDLPDHGLSPRSDSFSFENYATQIALTLQSINIEKAFFVGHSLGGKVAMYLSHINPHLVEKLIVLDIAPVKYESRHENVIKGLTSVDLLSIHSRSDAQDALSQFVMDKGTQGFLLKSLYEHESKWDWRFNLELLIRDYDKLRDWPLSDDNLYTKNVLFIKGQHSDYITGEHQATILRQFPKAKAKIVNAGHWLHAEKPQVVNTLITKHLLG